MIPQSMKNKVIGAFAKLMNLIPTRRPQDEAVNGVGKIVSVVGETLKGKGTEFTKSVGEKFTISITSPKAHYLVKKVIDDETLEVINKENLPEAEDIDQTFKITPKLDQADLFNNCNVLLADKKVVGIFPEVSSSNERAGLTIEHSFFQSKPESPISTLVQ